MNSPILFLTCCSNRKIAGGDDRYQSEYTIQPSIREERGRALLEARRSVCSRIHDGAKSAQGTELRSLPYNGQLVCGPDFGRTASGLYWPAMKRYRGRFYQEIDPDESGVLGESPHHWLIVSALYGLLTPAEPIQMYSCHTLDDAGRLASIWTHDGLLTSLLLEYVRVSNVTLIVDLTADLSYHRLFNWERVRRRVRVLRAFGAQNVGPSLLPALGFLVRDRLLTISAEELTGLEDPKTYITDYEDIVLTQNIFPPPPFPLPSEEAPLPSDGEPVLQEEWPQPPNESHEGCVVLPHSRQVPVTSDDHRTIFGNRINHIRELPPEPRRLFDKVSRAAEVLSVRLGPFTAQGSSRIFNLALANYRQGQGFIDGTLRGPGRIGGIQRFRIQVTPGREQATYLAISRLLDDEAE